MATKRKPAARKSATEAKGKASVRRGAAARKAAAKKTAAKKTAAKKTAANKTAAKGPAVKGPSAGKSAMKGRVGRKPVLRQSTAKKPPVGARVRGTLKGATGEALRLAGIGTDAVAKATGRAWDQWLALLDAAGAVRMAHKEIAALLAGKYAVPSWWSQMLTVGYEQARGLREAHQRRDGFSANASRTLSASLERLYGAWADPKLRALWLGRAPVVIGRTTDGKSMRMTWTAGNSSIDVNFYPVGDGRSRVQVQHDKLADADARQAQKAFWGEALERLKAMLEKAA